MGVFNDLANRLAAMLQQRGNPNEPYPTGRVNPLVSAAQLVLRGTPGEAAFRRTQTPVNILPNEPQGVRQRLGRTLAETAMRNNPAVIAATSPGRGAFVFKNRGEEDLSDTLRHEVAHDILGVRGVRIPRVLEEALAGYVGGEPQLRYGPLDFMRAKRLVGDASPQTLQDLMAVKRGGNR